jgi:hypothetical protein
VREALSWRLRVWIRSVSFWCWCVARAKTDIMVDRLRKMSYRPDIDLKESTTHSWISRKTPKRAWRGWIKSEQKIRGDRNPWSCNQVIAKPKLVYLCPWSHSVDQNSWSASSDRLTISWSAVDRQGTRAPDSADLSNTMEKLHNPTCQIAASSYISSNGDWLAQRCNKVTSCIWFHITRLWLCEWDDGVQRPRLWQILE